MPSPALQDLPATPLDPLAARQREIGVQQKLALASSGERREHLAELVLGWLADDRARHLALVENPEHLFKLPAFAVA